MEGSENKPNFKEKAEYFLNNLMQKGTIFMVLLLFVLIVAISLFIGLLISSFHQGAYNNLFLNFWDAFANAINSWMPRVSDTIEYNKLGEIVKYRIGYIPLATLSAFAGILFSSTLIAIISAGFVGKINELQKGYAKVIEEGHIVLLGFVYGDLSLLKQLFSVYGDKKLSIVIGCKEPKQKMEEYIKTHITIPKNCKIICRHIDVTDKQNLIDISVDKAKSIVINTFNDNDTFMALLCVHSICVDNNDFSKNIIVGINDEHYHISEKDLDRNNLSVIMVHDAISRAMAHTCSCPGLATAFKYMLDLEKNRFLVQKCPSAYGKSFAVLSNSIHNAVPIGIYNNNTTMLNPSKDYVIQDGDEIITLQSISNYKKSFNKQNDIDAMNNTILEIDQFDENIVNSEVDNTIKTIKKENYLIIGYNDCFKTIINEIEPYAKSIIVIGISPKEEKKIEIDVDVAKCHILTFTDYDFKSLVSLEQLLNKTDHVVILSSHNMDNDSDAFTMLLLLKIRNIKEQNKLNFSVLTEMNQAKNIELIQSNDLTDYIVPANFASKIISQLIVNPKMRGTIRDFLTTTGNEIAGKVASQILDLNVEYKVSELRQLSLLYESIFLGYIKNDIDRKIVISPSIDEKIKFDEKDILLFIAKVS